MSGLPISTKTEKTAARVKYAFDHGKVRIDELADPGRTLHIDSKVLEKAEAREEEAMEARGVEIGAEENEETPARRLTKEEHAERLRVMVDTVGVLGQPGEIQNVISVGMLSEGWDAKTVTHVMGLRAFSSQLLCEQVVGRGLRRTSYEVDPDTGLFTAEYVNIFGVPFTFLPHEGGDDVLPPPPTPMTLILVPASTSFSSCTSNLSSSFLESAIPFSLTAAPGSSDPELCASIPGAF